MSIPSATINNSALAVVHGDVLDYRYTKVIEHDEQQWQFLDELMERAERYWNALPPEERDFDRAKAEFMQHYT